MDSYFNIKNTVKINTSHPLYKPDKAAQIDRLILDNEESVNLNYLLIESIQEELDELLESIGESDDRKISPKDQSVYLNLEISEILKDDKKFGEIFSALFRDPDEPAVKYEKVSSYLQPLGDHLKDFFDIADDDLANNFTHYRRFALEVGRAALQIRNLILNTDLDFLHKESLKFHQKSQDIGNEQIKKELESIQRHIERGKWMEEAKTQLEKEQKPIPESIKPIVIQFEIIQELESKLRELLKNVFSDQQDWWEKYVPIEVRDKLEYRNRKDPNFERLRKDQSLELIDLLMFREVQIIITGSGFDNYEFFKNIFPNYHYVNERLIEASLLRNPVCHMNELNEKQQKQLLHIKEELVDHINEYLGI